MWGLYGSVILNNQAVGLGKNNEKVILMNSCFSELLLSSMLKSPILEIFYSLPGNLKSLQNYEFVASNP